VGMNGARERRGRAEWHNSGESQQGEGGFKWQGGKFVSRRCHYRKKKQSATCRSRGVNPAKRMSGSSGQTRERIRGVNRREQSQRRPWDVGLGGGLGRQKKKLQGPLCKKKRGRKQREFLQDVCTVQKCDKENLERSDA